MTDAPSIPHLDQLQREPASRQARYEALLDAAPVGLLLTTGEGSVVEANRAAAALLGTTREEMIGTPLAAYLPASEHEAHRRELAAAGEEPARAGRRTELLRRDGERIAMQLTVTPSRSESDELCWVIQDVSEVPPLLETVIENIPAGLVVVDRSGEPVHANADAHRMLQHQPAEARDLRSWRDTEAYHLDGRRLQPDEWPLARTLATGEVVNGEKYEVVLGGRRGILEISTAPIVSADGELTGALAIFQDVSTQEQSERAERDFVTNAAHELQSPLAAIVSAIEVLQAGAKEGPQRDVFLGHIERAADRLARLVRALLILARTQSGLEAPRDELVALCPLLAEVSSVLTLSPAVELELDCPDDLAVVTNRELVEQALVNLAENAAKQTRTGRILLRARESPGARVEVTVADTGPGIPATDRLRVFERFYRSDRSSSQGFGLGLAIVRAVADALEGEVELDSAPGAGTTVTLRIPNAASMVTR